MVNFGEELASSRVRQWEQFYINYDGLKRAITDISGKALSDGIVEDRVAPFSAGGDLRSEATVHAEQAHALFLEILEADMKKIDRFVATQLEEVSRSRVCQASLLPPTDPPPPPPRQIRAHLNDLEAQVQGSDAKQERTIKVQLDNIGLEIMEMEKFVNINFNGFHKILKKHDKHVPKTFACMTVYLMRLQRQPWVAKDNGDATIVQLSRIHSKIRHDRVIEPPPLGQEEAGFIRKTTKYWVKTEDVSKVKYEVLKHLPVFLMPGTKVRTTVVPL
jgi:SPX domain protein involved in polyphosphate accumulation